MSRLAVAVILLAVGCSDDSGRPPCNLGNCFERDGGEDDGDSGSDADGDADADDVDCTDPDGDDSIDLRCPNGTDCAEGDPSVSPSAPEVCNFVDDDCSGGADDALLQASGGEHVLPAGPDMVMTLQIAFASGADGFGLLHTDQDASGDEHLYFQKLGLDLTASGAPIELSDRVGYHYHHALALTRVEVGWVAAYSDQQPDSALYEGIITAASVPDAGDVVTTIVHSEPGGLTPSLATGASTTGLVWNQAEIDLRFAVLSADGTEVVATGVIADADVGRSTRPSITWTGDHYLLSVVTGGGAQLFSLSEDGTLDAHGTIAQGDPQVTAIAWDGLEAAVTWTEFATNDSFLQVVDDQGRPVGDGVELPAGKLPRINAVPRAFALVRFSPVVEIETFGGELEVLMLGHVPAMGAPYVVAPYVGGETESKRDPWIVPANDGWAIAWIDDPRWGPMKADLLTCAE